MNAATPDPQLNQQLSISSSRSPASSNYQVGGSLPVDATTYVTRQADRDLYKAVRTREFCYVLNSRQMGKSSLKVRTMQRLQVEGVACAAIDITAIGTSITEEQWYVGMINRIVRPLRLRREFNLEAWWEEHRLLSYIQRFGLFIEDVLLEKVTSDVVIFIDEIDSVLSLPFSADDLFAFIRECYNQRANNPSFRRLTFVLLGVCSPSDLMQDKQRTPFNIGRSIELSGFRIQEAAPLGRSLTTSAQLAKALMAVVLAWTGGQPFLTQKICRLVAKSIRGRERISPNQLVSSVVQKSVIENWEAQDVPEHLKTIRDRLFRSGELRTGRLLWLYQQILKKGEVDANDSPEQVELRLTGLVVRMGEKLRVYNPIYRTVFDETWLEKSLEQLRPYGEALRFWEMSGRKDQSKLLRGESLDKAQAWTKGKSLGDADYQFLNASKELLQQGILAKERQEAREIVAQAGRQAQQLMLGSFVGVGVALTVTAGAIAGVLYFIQEAKDAGADSLRAKLISIETRAKDTREAIESRGQLSSLIQAIQLGRELQNITTNFQTFTSQNKEEITRAINQVRATLISTQRVSEKNIIKAHSGNILGLSLSPDGNTIVSGGEDGFIRFWSHTGKHIEVEAFREPSNSILDVGFSRDGEKIVVSGFQSTRYDSPVKILSATGQVLGVLKGHKGHVLSANFSLDGTKIVTGGTDCKIKLWNSDGEFIRDIQNEIDETTCNNRKSWVWSTAFSPSGELIASGSHDGVIKIWSIKGHKVARMKGTSTLPVFSVNFSPEGDVVASGGKDGRVKLWSLDGKLVKNDLKGSQDAVWSVEFSPDGKALVSGGLHGTNGTMLVWSRIGDSWSSGQTKREITIYGHRGMVRTTAFSHDGRKIISGGKDGNIKLWSHERAIAKQRSGEEATISVGSSIPIKQGNLSLQAQELDELINEACSWASDYLHTNNPTVSDKDRTMCRITPQDKEG